MKDLLTHLERCWWSIKIKFFEDKWHFLQYAGRYVRRPPIAQRRITWIGQRTVGFWYKDKKLRRRVEVHCSLNEFGFCGLTRLLLLGNDGRRGPVRWLRVYIETD